jgi:hypothetical protein
MRLMRRVRQGEARAASGSVVNFRALLIWSVLLFAELCELPDVLPPPPPPRVFSDSRRRAASVRAGVDAAAGGSKHDIVAILVLLLVFGGCLVCVTNVCSSLTSSIPRGWWRPWPAWIYF